MLFLALSGCFSASSLTPDWQDMPEAGPNAWTAELPAGVAAEDRVLVKWTSAPPVRVKLGSTEVKTLRRFDALAVDVLAVPAHESVDSLLASLRSNGAVEWAEPDFLRVMSVNDPYVSYQWHLSSIDAEGAWNQGVTGSGVVVAVVDTGVSTGGSDTPSMVAGYDFVSNDSNASDGNGHGTHVAGTIAQATNNAVGVAGVAYGAQIMPVRVLNNQGSGYSSDIIAGINWAVSNGANVINLSLGSSYYSASEASAVSNAASAGVLVVAAAGNSGAGSVDYPAAYSGAMAVGATDYNNSLAWYSNSGSALDIVAPGGDTSVDANGDGYVDGVLQETFSGNSWGYYFYDGTSMASPHVAGVAALLMSQGATAAEAEAAMTATAMDLGSGGWDSTYGHGLVDASAAVASYGGGGTDTATDTADTGDTGDTGPVDTGTPDTTGPVVSDVTSRQNKKRVWVVEFTTDEDATARFCTNRNRCSSWSSTGTSHTLKRKDPRATSFTIEAEDTLGNTSTSGPYTF